jgi:hypothetical protein
MKKLLTRFRSQSSREKDQRKKSSVSGKANSGTYGQIASPKVREEEDSSWREATPWQEEAVAASASVGNWQDVRDVLPPVTGMDRTSAATAAINEPKGVAEEADPSKGSRAAEIADYLSSLHQGVLKQSPEAQSGARDIETANSLPGGVCSVCRNLNPEWATNNREWARHEFNVGDNVHAGVAKIDSAGTLLDAAQGGCLRCSVLWQVLEDVAPGWADEQVFLHVYIATGMPVVVKLSFGAQRTVTLAGGLPSQPGRPAEISWNVLDGNEDGSLKEPIEVEIYRKWSDSISVFGGKSILALLQSLLEVRS